MTITMTITLTLTLTLTKTYSDIYIYAKTVHPLLGIHLIIYIKGIIAAGRYKINPRERLCCITAVDRFKVAKFEYPDSNVKKTSFRDWAYNCPRVSFHRCYLLRPPTAGAGFTLLLGCDSMLSWRIQ